MDSDDRLCEAQDYKCILDQLHANSMQREACLAERAKYVDDCAEFWPPFGFGPALPTVLKDESAAEIKKHLEWDRSILDPLSSRITGLQVSTEAIGPSGESDFADVDRSAPLASAFDAPEHPSTLDAAGASAAPFKTDADESPLLLTAGSDADLELPESEGSAFDAS